MSEQLHTHTHTHKTNLGCRTQGSGDPGELDRNHPSCSGAPRGIVGTCHPKQTLESGPWHLSAELGWGRGRCSHGQMGTR